MKLTESKLKKLILEMMEEKRQMAEKIFSLIKQSMYSDDKSHYNQAVTLAVGANLVNEVLELYDEYISMEMSSPEKYLGPSGYGPTDVMGEVYKELKQGRNQFYQDAAKEISLSAGSL